MSVNSDIKGYCTSIRYYICLFKKHEPHTYLLPKTLDGSLFGEAEFVQQIPDDPATGEALAGVTLEVPIVIPAAN